MHKGFWRKCELCGYVVTIKAQLKIHFKVGHKGITYKREQCDSEQEWSQICHSNFKVIFIPKLLSNYGNMIFRILKTSHFDEIFSRGPNTWYSTILPDKLIWLFKLIS